MIKSKLQYVMMCDGDVDSCTFTRELFIKWEHYFVLINTMAYGVNKFGERLIHVDVIDDELNMNGNKIVGLPNYVGELAGEGDAVSKRILLDVLDRLNNIF